MVISSQVKPWIRKIDDWHRERLRKSVTFTVLVCYESHFCEFSKANYGKTNVMKSEKPYLCGRN